MGQPDLDLVGDLARAYDIDVDRSRWSLTPRMALQLLCQAQYVSDFACGHPGYFGDVGALPSIAVEVATPEFLDRFRRSFDDLAHRLRHPSEAGGSLPQCVGDEVALAHLLDAALGCSGDPEEMALLEPELGLLPASPEFDSNFLFYEDALFADRDFELLFQDITDAEGSDLEALGLRLVNLRPDRWFLPFP